MLFLNCEDPYFLTLLLFINTFINLIRILLPIFLIVLLGIDIFKYVTSPNLSDEKKIKKVATNRIAASLIVFLVPTVVYLVIGMVSQNRPNLAICMNNANLETIGYLREQNEREREMEWEEDHPFEVTNEVIQNVAVETLLNKGSGKLDENQLGLLKNRMVPTEWKSDMDDKNPTTILVNYDNGQFITIKSLGSTKHMDFAPADSASSKMYKSWFGSWNWIRKGAIVYINGQWAASAFHGCPHGSGIVGNGLDEIVSDNESCAVSDGYDVINGGHFCLHLTGSTTHVSGQPSAEAQAEISRILSDSENYK